MEPKVQDDFFNKMYEQEQGAFDYTMEGNEQFLTYMTNELTGWKIGGTLFKAEN